MRSAEAVAHSPGWSEASRRFVWINVLGGAAVLASYAWGLAWLGDRAGEAWGGVPQELQRWYTVSMLAAAAGYFPMTHFVLGLVRSGRAPRGLLDDPARLYLVVLAGSAAWLPLTCLHLEAPAAALWWLIRADLAAVGLASLAVLALVARSGDGAGSSRWLAALAGAAAFCLQTAVLDAVVWPSYFPAGA